MEKHMLYIDGAQQAADITTPVLSLALRREVVHVPTATRGFELLQRYTHLFAGVIVNAQLPEMSGLDFFQVLRRRSERYYEGLFRAIASSSGDQQLLEEAATMNVPCVHKQDDPLLFASAMYRLLEKHAPSLADLIPSGMTQYSHHSGIAPLATARKVLYVDDEGMDRLRNGIALRERFAETIDQLVVAGSAPQGWRNLKVEPQNYVGVISDLEMPKVDGLRFLEYIGRQPSLSHVARILVSSHAQAGYISQQAAEIGAAFVPKQALPRAFASAVYNRFQMLQGNRYGMPTVVPASEWT